MKSELIKHINFIEKDTNRKRVISISTFSQSTSPFLSEEEGFSEFKIQNNFISMEDIISSGSISENYQKDLASLYGIDSFEILKNQMKKEIDVQVEKRILKEIKGLAHQEWTSHWTKFQIWANKKFGYEPKFTWKSSSDFNQIVTQKILELIGKSDRLGGNIFVILNPSLTKEFLEFPGFCTSETGHDYSPSEFYGKFKNPLYPSQWVFMIIDRTGQLGPDEIVFGFSPEDIRASKSMVIYDPNLLSQEMATPYDTQVKMKRSVGFDFRESKDYLSIKIAKKGKSHNLLTHLIEKLKLKIKIKIK